MITTRPRNAMDTTTGPVETTLANFVGVRLRQSAVVKRNAYNQKMRSTRHGVAVLIAGQPVPAIIPEGSVIPLADAELTRADIEAVKIGVRTAISNELMEDAGDNTEFLKALAYAAADNVSYYIDNLCIMNGQGVVTSISEALTANSIVQVNNVQSIAVATFAEMMSLTRESFDAGPNKFYMNRKVFAQAATNLQGSVGYIGEDAMLFGIPVEFTQGMTVVGDAPTSGDCVALYGRMKSSCVFGIGREDLPSVKILNEIGAANDQSQMQVTYRFGFTCHDNDGGTLSGLFIT